jgi:anti-sigma factor RsiW
MQIDCEAVRDGIDAWALGALDAAETRALESHLAGCAACTALADEARGAAGALALAVPLAPAPPSLKGRVMASAGLRTEVSAGRLSATRRWWGMAAAASIVIGAGVIAWGGYLQTRVNDLEDRDVRAQGAATAQSSQFATMRTELVQASAQNVSLASNQDAVLDIVSQADVQRLPMSGTSMAPSASGRYIWSRTGGLGALVASNLPPLPEGQSYSMWVVYENAWINGGSFTVDASGGGHLIVRDLADGQDHGAFRGFAVTVEPSTGATKRTGAMVLQTGLN